MDKQNDKETSLRFLLNEHRVLKGETFSHSSREPAQTYYIDEDGIDKFWRLVCSLVSKGSHMTLMERSGTEFSPLRVDFDFKTSIDDGTERRYTKELILKIVKIYQFLMKEITDEDVDNQAFSCILLEKSAPRVEEDHVKDGFHLHFPYFICESWVIEHLRERCIELINKEKLFSNMNLYEPIERIVDSKIATKCWHLYGSGKSGSSEPFKITDLFDGKTEYTTINNMFSEKIIELKERFKWKHIETYLPILLSIRCFTTPTPLKTHIEELRESVGIRQKKKQLPIQKTRSEADILTDIKTIKDGRIIEMLKEERVESYEGWIDVGITLFNIGFGHDEALDLWIEFSRRSRKFKIGECEQKWSTFDMRGKSIASLFLMARLDSPEKFREWKSTNLKQLIYESLRSKTPTELDVGRVVSKMYEGRFLCADAKRNKWYEFRDHRWRSTDDAISLRRLLIDEVKGIYEEMTKEIGNNRGGDEDSRSESMIKACHNIVKSLGTERFHRKLVDMCKLFMYDGNFYKRLNENRSVWVCENGVLDLDLGIFREGRPDDYMSLSSGISYTNMNDDDDDVRDVREFLRKFLPNTSIRDYILSILATAMRGGNYHKKFLMFTGTFGNNGKSKFFQLLELVFGEYSIKFPRDMFVGKNNGSASARPELARARGRRLASVQEIAKHETINIGVIKELTGMDTFFTRGLYEEGGEVKPMFTLMMQLNEIPKIPGHDKATFNRLRKIDCVTVFDASAPKSAEEQRKKNHYFPDISIEEKLPSMAPALLWILFQIIRKTPKDTTLDEPPQVIESTEEFRTQNDVYMEFIKERLVKDIEGVEISSMLSVNTAYSDFKDWYLECYGKVERISKIVFRNELSKHIGGVPNERAKWVGWRLNMNVTSDGEGVFGTDPS